MKFIDDFIKLEQTICGDLFDTVDYPWEALPLIGEYILRVGPTLKGYELFGDNIWVGEGVSIAQTASVSGPAIIGAGTEIRHGAYIRGNVIIGEKCTIGNSTEVKSAFLANSVQTPHFNYVGDTIMGYKSHIGAGVILSNVRSLPGTVIVTLPNGTRLDTGLRKFSALIGDGVEVGCNAVLNPGTIVGRGSVIYPLTSVRGCIKEKVRVKQNLTQVPLPQ
ncbi:UDP-N-acetylglucosamine pyrophosphorylase [bacterium]|nr:UDP-N-acetylglucosamine pyrophosphorylase [bacterium]